MNTTAIRALVRNDLRLYLTDRRAIVVGVLVPILIAAFFGYVFGRNGNSDNGKIPLAVVDQDNSEVTRAIVADFAADTLVSMQALDRSGAEDRVRAGKMQVAAVLAKDFGARRLVAALLIGNQARPDHRPADRPQPGHQQPGGGGIAGAARHGGNHQAGGENFMASSSGRRWRPRCTCPYAVVTANVTITRTPNIPYNGYAHSFAGMTTQFILLAGIDAGVVLLLMRDRGVWQRLRSAPLSRAEFIVARTAATTLISLFQFTLIYLAAVMIFGVRIGGRLRWGFVGIARGAMFSERRLWTHARRPRRLTPAQRRGIAAMVTLLMVMVGGAWVPSFVFPGWLQKASLLAPTRWAVDGLDGATWRGTAVGPLPRSPPFSVLVGALRSCVLR